MYLYKYTLSQHLQYPILWEFENILNCFDIWRKYFPPAITLITGRDVFKTCFHILN